MTRIVDTTPAFIAEKESEGFSLAEILALYEVVAPLTPMMVEIDGKLKVHWDVDIVERGSEE